MKAESIIFALFIMPTYLIIHLLICYIQVISTRDYFYGVYIKNIKIDEQEKKRIHKAYKKRIQFVFFIIIIFTIIAKLLSLNWILILNLAMLIYLIVSYGYLRKYYLEVKQIKINYLKTHQELEAIMRVENKDVMVDSVFLNEQLKLKNKFKRLFSICIGLSLLSLLYQIIMYDTLPDTVITHWGINGEPDGFSPKNIKNVFMINMVDIPMVLLFAVTTVEIVGTKIYLDTSKIDVNRKKALAYLNGLGYSFLILTLGVQLVTTTIPFFMSNQLSIPIGLTITGIISPLLCLVPIIYNFIKLSAVKSKNPQVNLQSSSEDHWRYGFIYYNKQDPSFMVEKRFGAGWTMNMAHKKSVLFYGLLIIPLILIIILTFSY